MSGGYFDYKQFGIEHIAKEIDELIKDNDDKTPNEWGVPIGRGYSQETIERFKEAAHNLRRAAEMAQRVDWLVSSDDSEKKFHERWREEVRPPFKS